MKRYSFFDIDETLISCKSLLEVFKYYCENTGVDELHSRHTSMKKNMIKMVSDGVDRNQINRHFYSNFQGISQIEMQKLASDWFQIKKAEPGFFYSSVVHELKKHQSQGNEVILISGSFMECVKPIADYFSIKEYLCINLECIDGIYTGHILGEQTIGEGKKYAIEKYIMQKNISLEGSYGYGDHESDLPFLLMVEHPVAVGANDSLINYAKANHWQIIPYEG